MAMSEPSYLAAWKDGTLEKRIKQGLAALTHCSLCPRRCKVDRTQNETGYCQTGRQAKVASFNAHFGEEAPLVGKNGSGTIFFSHCNLLCNFCQNFEISHHGEGRRVTDDELAQIMLQLQNTGCHNINLVTPSHVVPQILSAVGIAAEKGLRLPLIFNTGGYDNVATLKLLEGIVDIFMPDFKFWAPSVARMACSAEDYPKVARKALVEMHRQVGDLCIDDISGLAYKGLLVRHLVLPAELAGTAQVMHFIARTLSRNTYVNIMDQYRPCGRAATVPSLATPLSTDAYTRAVAEARAAGITRLDKPRRVFQLW